MKFKITVDGGSVVWEDGKLSGDKMLMMILEKMAREYEGKWIGEAHLGGTDHAHLESPLSVYLILKGIFKDIRHEGDKIPLESPEDRDSII